MKGVHLACGRRFGRARAHFVEAAEDMVSLNGGMAFYWDHGPRTMTGVCDLLGARCR